MCPTNPWQFSCCYIIYKLVKNELLQFTSFSNAIHLNVFNLIIFRKSCNFSYYTIVFGVYFLVICIFGYCGFFLLLSTVNGLF